MSVTYLQLVQQTFKNGLITETEEGQVRELFNVVWKVPPSLPWHDDVSLMAGVLQGVFMALGKVYSYLMEKHLPYGFAFDWDTLGETEYVSKQLIRTVRELMLEPTTSAAVVYIGRREDGYDYRPRLSSVQFILREGRLYTTLNVREWELLRDMPHDVIAWDYISQCIGAIVGADKANLTCNIGVCRVEEASVGSIPSVRDGPSIRVTPGYDWEGYIHTMRMYLREDWMSEDTFLKVFGVNVEDVKKSA